jgi:predicted dehydrogenase
VLGTGWIAERFVTSVLAHTAQRFVAVGSRDRSRAAAFAGRFGIGTAHGSYDDLVADPEVDVVYVATPHPSHHADARLVLEAGKHVLVEKPITVDAEQARDLAALAEQRGLFCMEALWTLFLPKFDVIRQLLDDGALGEPHTVLADHGEYFAPEHRIMRAELGGGPLFDLGTYPISFASWVLGPPTSLHVLAEPHPAGVSGQLGMIMQHDHERQAVLHTTIMGPTPTTGVIAGERGTLVLPGPFYQPGPIVITDRDQTPREVWTESLVAHDALHFEAAEVARRVAAGERESPLRPLADSVALLTTMDEIRRQVG